jgi:hypothetical protein
MQPDPARPQDCLPIMKCRKVACGLLETYSLVYPGLPCDETKYIQESVDLLGITPNLVESSDPAMWFYPEEARRSKEFPGYPNDVSGEWQPIASNGLQKPYIPALRG